MQAAAASFFEITGKVIPSHEIGNHQKRPGGLARRPYPGGIRERIRHIGDHRHAGPGAMTMRILKITGIAAGVLIVVALAALAGLQVFLGTDTAGGMIRSRINSRIPGHVHWKKQRVSVFKGRVRLEGLAILDTEKHPLITVESLFADFGLTELLSGAVIVENARIQKPEADLAVDRHGRVNVAGVFSAPGKEAGPFRAARPAPDFNVRINRLELDRGSLSLETGSGDRLNLEDIGILLEDADMARKAGKLRLSVQDGHVSVPGAKLPLGPVSLEAALDGDRIDPFRLELQAAGAHLAVSGTVADVFGNPLPDIRLALSAELSKIGSILDMDTELAGLKAGKITVQARIRDKKAVIERLAAALAGGTIQCTGTIDLQQAFANGFAAPPAAIEALSYRLDITAQDLRLSQFPGAAPVSGELSGRLALEGAGIFPGALALRADAELRARRISPTPQISLPDLRILANTEFKDSRLRIGKLTIDAPEFRVQADGTYDLSKNRVSLDASADIPDPARVAGLAGITGIRGEAAHLQAHVSGPVLRPAAKARLHAGNLRLRDVRLGDIHADIAFSNGRLEFDPFRISNRESGIRVSGSIGLLDGQTGRLASDPALELAVESRELFLQDFLPAVRGRAWLSGSITGSVKNPRGGLNVHVRDLQTGVQPVAAVDLEARIRGRRIYMEPLEIQLARAQGLAAHGWISLDRKYDLQITSDPVRLAKLKMLENTGIDGKLEISARGAGSFGAPQMEAGIRVSGLAVEGRALPDIIAGAKLRDTGIRLEITEPFSVNARYDLSAHDFSAKARMAGTELSPFFQLAGLQGFTGKILGSLEAEGNARRIRNTRAHLTVSRLDLAYRGYEIASARDLAAFLENGEIRLPGNRITLLQQGTLDIRASGNLEREMDIRARCELPAAVAEGLSPEIHSLQGRVNLLAHLRGTAGEPDLSARLTLRDLGLTINRTMQQVRGVSGEVRLTREQVVISGISGRIDKGGFSLEGTLALENYRPARAKLSISARALPVEIPETLEMQISTDLELSGTPQAASLSGNVVLMEGRYFKDVNLSIVDRIGEIGRRQRQATPRAEQLSIDPPLIENLSLNISVDHRDPFMVDNNLALLAIRPRLDIRGTARNPVVTGRAEIVEGTVTYRGTAFEVKKGVIDFINPYRIEPAVDIRAEAEMRKWTIALDISGTPENLDFQLSSNPPEQDADIVSLLAVGKTTRELSGTSAAGRSPEEMLAGLLAGRLETKLKAGTGLDIVELQYQENGGEGKAAGEVRVTLGKELSRRLTVKYGLERKSGEMVQQSTAIYKLMENLSANAYQDTQGAFGGEMRYRLEFR